MTVTYAIFLKGSYMRLFFRILLTITATFWMVAVYIIKTGECIYGIPSWAFGLFLLAIPVFISLIIIEISKSIEPEQLTMCEEFSLTDRDFLPTYLGYFFVSLSINDNITMSILSCSYLFFCHRRSISILFSCCLATIIITSVHRKVPTFLS